MTHLVRGQAQAHKRGRANLCVNAGAAARRRDRALGSCRHRDRTPELTCGLVPEHAWRGVIVGVGTSCRYPLEQPWHCSRFVLISLSFWTSVMRVATAPSVLRNRAAVAEELRRLLPKMEGSQGGKSLPFGLAAIDRHLPQGGLAAGALHEIVPETGATPTAFGFLMALLAHIS